MTLHSNAEHYLLTYKYIIYIYKKNVIKANSIRTIPTRRVVN